MKILSIYHSRDTMGLDMSLGFSEFKDASFSFEVVEADLMNPSILHNKLLKIILKENITHIFSINGFYILESPAFIRFLNHLKITICPWFVDNPFYFFDRLTNLKTCLQVLVFQWEKFYILFLEELIRHPVIYLPQATNPERFKPSLLSTDEIKNFEQDLIFAANLDLDFLEQMLEKFKKNNDITQSDLNAAVLKGSIWQLQHRKRPSYEAAAYALGKHYESISAQSCLFGRIVEYNLSIQMRCEMVNNLEGFPLGIWGEISDWKRANVKARLLGRINYFTNMPKAVSGARINLNLSRFQQRSGTNQRVFDVPAAGSVILTDYREELEELFDLDSELFVFKHMDELKIKVPSLLASAKDKLTPVVEKGRERVLNAHTYKHRAGTVMKSFLSVRQLHFTPPVLNRDELNILNEIKLSLRSGQNS